MSKPASENRLNVEPSRPYVASGPLSRSAAEGDGGPDALHVAPVLLVRRTRGAGRAGTAVGVQMGVRVGHSVRGQRRSCTSQGSGTLQPRRAELPVRLTWNEKGRGREQSGRKRKVETLLGGIGTTVILTLDLSVRLLLAARIAARHNDAASLQLELQVKLVRAREAARRLDLGCKMVVGAVVEEHLGPCLNPLRRSCAPKDISAARPTRSTGTRTDGNVVVRVEVRDWPCSSVPERDKGKFAHLVARRSVGRGGG